MTPLPHFHASHLACRASHLACRVLVLGVSCAGARRGLARCVTEAPLVLPELATV